MSERPRILRYDGGTLLLEGFPIDEVPPGFVHDPRVGLLRGPAMRYAPVVLDLHRRGVPYQDEARRYVTLDRGYAGDRSPRTYQGEALGAWRRAGRRGVVVLPTGAGKSLVAELCIADANRSALVVAPTLDLVGQWYDRLRRVFGEPIGLLGGGVQQVEPLTVATYDSASLQAERLGDRFGLVVFDEVHHLPGPSFSLAAECSIAPFRLGLTATLERPDGEHARVLELVGPVVHRREITELSGDFLASYRTEVLAVRLAPADRDAYERARATYRDFVESQGIRVGGPGGWQAFLRASARSKAGRQAFRAWLESRRILQGTEAKIHRLEEILRVHHGARILVFTNDNATVYDLSRRLLLPAITHETDVRERRELLGAFEDGSLPVLLTSRVLNEGVDLPAAEVAVVMSGTGTAREHVQRLGRILRKQGDKQAVLYELVVENTVEERTSARRRDHVAYRAP